MYKTQKDLQQRSHHAPPQIPNNPRVSHSSLRKSEKTFTKLVPQLDPSAHNLQNLKISDPKTQARATTRYQKIRQWLPSATRAATPGHALTHVGVLSHAGVNTHSQSNDVILHDPSLTHLSRPT